MILLQDQMLLVNSSKTMTFYMLLGKNLLYYSVAVTFFATTITPVFSILRVIKITVSHAVFSRMLSKLILYTCFILQLIQKPRSQTRWVRGTSRQEMQVTLYILICIEAINNLSPLGYTIFSAPNYCDTIGNKGKILCSKCLN